ncbi:alkaline phosphatase PhoX [Aureivirga sp. CE67]|uniref:alkaline phosphatase PhoX n=1 Tax=Aureivirga sp. CE67 TaxID=1788983 RepID=UPI0018CADBB5|nr:alkaline phosphatase PhoX [Aureivirga sp. CE67]
MKKTTLFLASTFLTVAGAFAQSTFPTEVEPDWDATEIVMMDESPMESQIIFTGGVDMVQTKSGETEAKQWHDFIGFTPVTDEDCVPEGAIGWVSVNHEMIAKDEKIGDGGGMTSFLVKRAEDGTFEVLDQTLSDGREGKFFNVDFSGVGETGMNCGGINSSIDGRIWTAEEWFRTSNESINDEGDGVRDISDYTIKYTDFDFANFQTIEKYQNFNWMVEIDPRNAKAIRKQYNWGRQGFEGGAIAPDNQTVYLGVDANPTFFTKFVADEPGDFTKGSLYVYKHDAADKWIEIDNEDFDKMLNYQDEAIAVNATMYNRIEWVTIDKNSGKVYLTETGRDNIGEKWADEAAAGAVFAPHHQTRAESMGLATPDATYTDYYGRILEFDPETNEFSVYLAGGPELAEENVAEADYPDKHLSNPDGLNLLYLNDKTYMLICEDLNGTSYGRMPAEFASNRMCELYMLDMSVEDPSIDDLLRIAQTPAGAEITGVCPTPDGKTIMFNSQHPSSDNPAPYNNSLTIALHGMDELINALEVTDFAPTNSDSFQIYPNPVERIVYLSKKTDVALYDVTGKRVAVYRNRKSFDVTNLNPGVYFVVTKDKETKKLVIK